MIDESLKKRIQATLRAMRETQRRAAEDRASAIGGVQERERFAIEEIRRTQGEAAAQRAESLAGVKSRELKALGGYSAAEELLRQGLAEPEAISPEIAAKMYEKGRTGIEAGTQTTQRRLQESFASRGMPGGAMLGGMMGAEEAGIGAKAGLQRDIDIERANRRRQDLLNLLGASTTLGGAKANIYGQTGRTLADIYGQTIAEVPKYSGGAFSTRPEFPQVTTVPGDWRGPYGSGRRY